MGTVGYMAPEQVRGQAADARSDIFALGVILYEMLTGRRAFKKATSAETMAAILNEDPPPLSQPSSTTPPSLQRVISRCLMKNPEQRFQHASDLAFALESLSDTCNSSAILLERAPVSRWPWIAIAIAGVLVTAAVGIWWMVRPGEPAILATRQLTNDGQAKTPALFTDGSRIYFNEGATRILKIVQIGMNGGEPATIPADVFIPAIAGLAPRGAALLLRSITGAQENPLWELPLPAGSAHPVNDLKVSDARYTPDGRLLYTQQGNLFIAESDGSKPRKLVDNVEGFLVSASMSPGGSRIAFESFTQNGVYSFVAKSDGSELHPVPNLTAHALWGGWGGTMCWSPDSKYLIVPRKEGHSTDLWLVPVETGWFRRLFRPMRLTQGPLNYTGAAVTHARRACSQQRSS